VKRKLRDIIKPAVTLFLICLIVSTALAFTHAVTKETIAERAELDKLNARKAVLTSATDFETIEGIDSLLKGNNGQSAVKEAYRGLNKGGFEGYVFLMSTKGYGGDMELTVGIDKEGKVSGVEIGENDETPGLGGKAQDKTFISQFSGLSIGEKLTTVRGKKSTPDEIQAISGATVTTKAVTEAVQTAMDAAEELMEKEGVAR